MEQQPIVVTSEERLCQLIDTSVKAALSNAQRQTAPAKETEQCYLNEAQLRELLGISHATVYRLRQQDKLPFLRIGNRILYDATEVRKAMEGQTLQGQTKKRRRE